MHSKLTDRFEKKKDKEMEYIIESLKWFTKQKVKVGQNRYRKK